MRDDVFDGNHLINGVLATTAVGLALVFAPTGVGVAVLVALAFVCGRLGGRDAGLGSVAVGTFLFGYAITEPHFRWEIENEHDVVLLLVLFFFSRAASELGARRRMHPH